MHKHFRVLVIDDQMATYRSRYLDASGHMDWAQWNAYCDEREKARNTPEGARDNTAQLVLTHLNVLARAHMTGQGPVLAAYIASQVPPDPENTHAIAAGIPEWEESFLDELDFLVLDLGGLGDLHPPWESGDEPPRATRPLDEQLAKQINESYSGIGWFLRNIEGPLAHCQEIVILSAQTPAQPMVQDLLLPFCTDFGRPFTRYWQKSGASARWITALIATHLHRHNNGFTLVDDDQGHIELAAAHDEPVLIVGPTGCGKEGTAQSIHDLWQATHEEPSTPGGVVAISCPMLTDGKEARYELFGAVDGSYTGQSGHMRGLLLAAAGVPPLVRGNGAALEDYMRQLRPYLDAQDPRTQLYRFTTTPRRVTLFLDEIGDASPELQLLLLRLLQEGEVHPVGIERPFHGLRLRVIAATSDPRVAAFAGVEIPQASVRTHQELSRPLRPDLLFRLRGQVIRKDGITVGNAQRVIEALLARRHSSAPKWTTPARKLLINRVKAEVEAAAAPPAGSLLAIFGHFRQVRRVIELADVHVSSAARRGLPGVGTEVTDEVLRHVWTPVRLLAPPAVDSSAASSEERQRLRTSIESAVSRGDVRLPGGWMWPQLKEAFSKLRGDDRADATRLLGKVTDDRSNTDIFKDAVGVEKGTLTKLLRERGNAQ